MFKNLDLYTQRYLQIIIVVLIIQSIYQYMQIPHSQWMITSIASIYARFTPGQSIQRAIGRVTGTFLGVAAVTIVWYMIHWNYNLFIIMATICLPIMVFINQLPYSQTIILNTVLSDLGTEYANSASMTLRYYVVDKIVCVIIVLSIVLTIEYLWFGRKNIPYLNFCQTKKILIKNLEMYLKLTCQRKSSAKNFKMNNLILSNFIQLQGHASDVKIMKTTTLHLNLNIEDFVAKTRDIIDKITLLDYSLTPQPDLCNTAELTASIKQQLELLSKDD